MESFYTKLLFILHFTRLTLSAPQQPEINDQFTKVTTTTEEVSTNKSEEQVSVATESKAPKLEVKKEIKEKKESRKYLLTENDVKVLETQPSWIDTIYEILTRPISRFLTSPKVRFVFKNVGTCLVNGAMEIVSHFLPAPLIPLIASAAGMVIPFEPVVMLKERMPVASYRRAFNKAMNSFLHTFDGYKLDSYDDDPYMTRRFNRRFMNDISGEKKKKSNDIV